MQYVAGIAILFVFAVAIYSIIDMIRQISKLK